MEMLLLMSCHRGNPWVPRDEKLIDASSFFIVLYTFENHVSVIYTRQD